MQQYLITTDELRSLTRDMSQHVDKTRIEVYIRESENIDIKSALGDALFLDVKEYPDKYNDLLYGCVYENRCGTKKTFSGLRIALAYYTYARIVKNGDSNVTRYGLVNKDSEYSSRPDIKEKILAYNDAFSVANMYLKECVAYLNENKEKIPLYNGNGGIKANKTVYKIIGE